MLHSSHHLRKYKHKRHTWTVFLIIVLPVILLLLAGVFAKVNLVDLSQAIGLSFYRLFIGYVISLIFGVGIAMAFGFSKKAEAILPVFDVLQNVPSFALIPVFALLFGYGTEMAIIFTATSVTWPILFYTLNALHTARTELNEAATVFGAKGWRRIIYYMAPLAFPSIVTGSIVGISIGWEAVIGVEIIGSAGGIGNFLSSAGANSSNQALIVGVVAVLCLVFILNKLVWAPLLNYTHRYAE